MPFTYRLEILPTSNGAKYYQSSKPSDSNAGVDLYIAAHYDPASLVDNLRPTLLNLGCSARLVRVGDDGSEEDVHYWLCPRSSIYKTGLVMANSQGVIDKSYRGTLMAPIWVVSPLAFMAAYKEVAMEGSRLFQIVAPDMGHISEVRIVESLPDSVRGAGGFGSTGSR
jgi:dUTPase